MSMTTLTMTDVAAIIALGVIVLAGIAAWLLVRTRRTERLRARFGDAEYVRATKEGGSRRRAESGLAQRAERVERFQVRRLALVDRARFSEAWRRVQSRFVDGPAGAVTEADRLLADVMATRGYPTSDVEQRAADISVDHSQVLKDYRTAHEIALRQMRGEASTEDLRQAMVHYRTLFEELVNGPEAPLPAVAS